MVLMACTLQEREDSGIAEDIVTTIGVKACGKDGDRSVVGVVRVVMRSFDTTYCAAIASDTPGHQIKD
jgi:hypothetical protein